MAKVTRRQFAGRGAAAAGAAALAATAPGLVFIPEFRVWVPAAVAAQIKRHGTPPAGLLEVAEDKTKKTKGAFGYMFEDMPAFGPPDASLRELAGTMRDPGGASLDNPSISAGFTFLGQFLDHDVTLDTSALTGEPSGADGLRNFRIPRLDLDSVYDGAPRDGDKLRLETRSDGVTDLPRDGDGIARIPDPRNEENLIIAQLQVLFIRFHNALVDKQRLSFEDTRRQAQFHWQWIVVHDFLPKFIGQSMVDRFVDDRPGQRANITLKFYKPNRGQVPFVPVEWAGAIYRSGHSLIRPFYRVNATKGAAIFGASPDESNLNGFRPIPASLVIDWRNFFQIPAGSGPEPANRARLFDTLLSGPLHSLPGSVVPPPDAETSLAARNLIRGKQLLLPSGQAVAREIGAKPLSNGDLGLSTSGLGDGAPLWFYVLKEAELTQSGHRLGEVGGTIVGETVFGLLRSDRDAYVNQPQGFVPKPPVAPAEGRFAMGDLINFATAARGGRARERVGLRDTRGIRSGSAGVRAVGGR